MGEQAGGRTSSPALLGLSAIALAALCWAVAAVFARGLFDRGVDPLALAASRSVVAMVGFGLLPAAWRRPEVSRPLAPVLLGISIALVNATYYVVISRLDVAVALVLQYTAPAAVVAWTALLMKRKAENSVLMALAGTFIGVVLVSGVTQGIERMDLLGVAIGLVSALLFATYTLLSERAGALYGVVGALFRGFVGASVMWTAYFIATGFPSELVAPENIGGVLFVGVIGTISPFFLFLWGVQQVKAERAAIAATLEPILAAAVAWVWLDQTLLPIQVIGGVLVIAAVAALQVRRDPVPALAPDP